MAVLGSPLGISYARSLTPHELVVSDDSRNTRGFKAVLLGDYGVGKTTLFRRIQQEVGDAPSTTTTTAMSMSWQSQSLDRCCTTITTSDGKLVELNLWDTGGSERYRTLTFDFFRKSRLVILVYRTDRPESLGNLRTWIDDSKPFLSPNTLYVLLGNVHTDTTDVVTMEMGDDFAETFDITMHARFSVKLMLGSTLTGFLTRAVEAAIQHSITQDKNSPYDITGVEPGIESSINNTGCTRKCAC